MISFLITACAMGVFMWRSWHGPRKNALSLILKNHPDIKEVIDLCGDEEERHTMMVEFIEFVNINYGRYYLKILTAWNFVWFVISVLLVSGIIWGAANLLATVF